MRLVVVLEVVVVALLTAGFAAEAAVLADAATFEVVAGESEARYRVRENVVGLPLSGAAVGVTREITGSILIGADGQPSAGSEVRVGVGSLQSDQRRRDAYVRDQALQSARFPTVRFVPSELRGLPWPLPEAGEVVFEILGELTVREVTRPALWQAAATVAGDRVVITAMTGFSFGELALTRPQVAFLLQVEDRLTLEVTLVLQRSR